MNHFAQLAEGAWGLASEGASTSICTSTSLSDSEVELEPSVSFSQSARRSGHACWSGGTASRSMFVQSTFTQDFGVSGNGLSGDGTMLSARGLGTSTGSTTCICVVVAGSGVAGMGAVGSGTLGAGTGVIMPERDLSGWNVAALIASMTCTRLLKAAVMRSLEYKAVGPWVAVLCLASTALCSGLTSCFEHHEMHVALHECVEILRPSKEMPPSWKSFFKKAFISCDVR